MIEEMRPQACRYMPNFVAGTSLGHTPDPVTESPFRNTWAIRRNFDTAVADFAETYADQNERDHAALAAAVADGRVEAQSGV